MSASDRNSASPAAHLPPPIVAAGEPSRPLSKLSERELEAELDRAGIPIAPDLVDNIDAFRSVVARNGWQRPPEPARPFPEPEDRGGATLSALGGVEYVEDLVRPGRIVVVAAEESTGKSYAIAGELAIRLAVAGGSFAGTWPILRQGPVLVLSEMHSDDDYSREATILKALQLTREALVGRYYRLPLASAAGDRPALQVLEWREWITAWLREHGALLAVFDTATGAAQVDPWGSDIQVVYHGLRLMLDRYPELAIVLIVHLKKPQGRGERRISDVLGEWGRWCDVLLLLEADGLERVKLTSRKRVRQERRIVATKAYGLLIDPQEIESSGPKVSAEKVFDAVTARPGLRLAELASELGVSKPTASAYVEKYGLRTDRQGPQGAIRVFPDGQPQSTAKHAPLVVSSRSEGSGPQTAKPPYIEGRLALQPLGQTAVDASEESEAAILEQLRMDGVLP